MKVWEVSDDNSETGCHYFANKQAAVQHAKHIRASSYQEITINPQLKGKPLVLALLNGEGFASTIKEHTLPNEHS